MQESRGERARRGREGRALLINARAQRSAGMRARATASGAGRAAALRRGAAPARTPPASLISLTTSPPFNTSHQHQYRHMLRASLTRAAALGRPRLALVPAISSSKPFPSRAAVRAMASNEEKAAAAAAP